MDGSIMRVLNATDRVYKWADRQTEKDTTKCSLLIRFSVRVPADFCRGSIFNTSFKSVRKCHCLVLLYTIKREYLQ